MTIPLGATLLTGASGTLGRAIVISNKLSYLLTPTRNELDITQNESVTTYFCRHQISTVIHTAALARMKDCHDNPMLAIKTNIMGTHFLVNAVANHEITSGRQIRFIHLSTDGVYPSIDGNYSETDNPKPYNFYGLTKLAAEYAVNRLKDHCIIRTRFTKESELNLPAATNSYSSAIDIDSLVSAIIKLTTHNFIGTINVGDKRISDYDRLKSINPAIKATTIETIQSNVAFKLSTDASMNCSRWKNL